MKIILNDNFHVATIEDIDEVGRQESDLRRVANRNQVLNEWITFWEREIPPRRQFLERIEQNVLGKADAIGGLLQKGVEILLKGQTIEDIFHQHGRKDMIMFSFKWSTMEEDGVQWDTFTSHLDMEKSATHGQVIYLLRDLEMHRLWHEKVSIQSFANGTVDSQDLLEEVRKLRECPLAVAENHRTSSPYTPSKKTYFETICPRALQGGSCAMKKMAWQCGKCTDKLEYGFDRKLYCSCGVADITEFRFFLHRRRTRNRLLRI